MKKFVLSLLSITLPLIMVAQSNAITGIVLNENSTPMSSVNIYIDGTLDGTSTTNEGKFMLETEEAGTIKLVASFIGYQTYTITKDIKELTDLQITLKPSTERLQDVVIVAGNYALKSSTLESQNAINLLTTGGSEGDLFKSLTMLPGTQIPDTDGRLLVRGGESRESQTFIDGMHVLSPYTANSPGSSSRSKYSPSHFGGINFSTGGYSPEYSQSLSSILPLETKDKNPVSKYGFSLMNVNLEGGGTKAWKNGSTSFTACYTDMTFYNATLHPGENKKWDIPYRDFSVRNQLRFNINKNTMLKSYYGYDKTRFRRWWEAPFGTNKRNMDYDEDNIYLNTTLRKKTNNNINYFAGIAYSWNRKSIENSLISGDVYSTHEREIHLKAKASKRFTNLYKLEGGVETYLRNYDMKYVDNELVNQKVNNNISGVFLSNDFNFSHKFFLNLSGRMEYSTLTQKYSLLPRAAVNYQLNNLIISAVAGKYQQTADNNYLVYNKKLTMETNLMTMIGAYYNQNKRIYQVEFYNKKYNNLPLLREGQYTSDGYGYSRGVDVFFDDRALFKKFDYSIAYSYNDSKRKYLHYPEEARPDYMTRHNASIALKHTSIIKKTILVAGVTNRFASGRPYHNPNEEGFMNSTTSFYHTLDLSLTVLPHPKFLVYASLSNVLNRKNIYGYTFANTPDVNGKFAAAPTTMYQGQAFYIGIFITLGKNVAYEPGHF